MSPFANRSLTQRRASRLHSPTLAGPARDTERARFVGYVNQRSGQASTRTIPFFFPPHSSPNAIFPVMPRDASNEFARITIGSFLENFRTKTQKVSHPLFVGRTN
jgi:hypothetical protein